MSSGIHALETTYHFLFVGILIVLGIMLFLCLIRACMGPTVADRLVSVNMMGTMVMVIIATLAVMMNESYLVDICIIYAMISFLAVIVLSKVIMGVHKEEEKHVEEVWIEKSENVEKEDK
ncbi:MAG: sodium:proton antiporter [Lachnospiraceae bacterium]|nr:sodium:proton antiporter [Lachnospiraceae bacterium]